MFNLILQFNLQGFTLRGKGSKKNWNSPNEYVVNAKIYAYLYAKIK